MMKENDSPVMTPPRGLAILAFIGPGLIWCSDMIGSGEVILTTRIGAILGTGVMWAIVVGIFLKFWIGIGGAHYTVCTGEGMIDMFDRIPGPRHWVVWIVLVVQFISATVAMGSIASAAGTFVNSLFPVSPYFWGWIISIISFYVVWSGRFNILKMIMSIFVLIMVVCVFYVSTTVFPGFSVILKGFILKIPKVPAWAISKAGISENPWREILPLMGWAAGGFASQVWYSYWVMGAGYGASRGRGYGRPADIDALKNMNKEDAKKLRGWCRVVYTDAVFATIITTVLTLSFLISGAVILGSSQLAPKGPKVAIILSEIFSSKWGAFGSILFLITSAIALIGTLMAQLAGWPRLLADAFRICIPKFQRKFSWKYQFRIFLIFFFITNMTIVFTFGLKPVLLVKTGAVLDGLLLTPLQAIWLVVGLFVVLPRMLSKENYTLLRPHWFFAVGLILAFLVFGYFCVFQIPFSLMN